MIFQEKWYENAGRHNHFGHVTLDPSRLIEGFEKPQENTILSELNEIPKYFLLSLFIVMSEKGVLSKSEEVSRGEKEEQSS